MYSDDACMIGWYSAGSGWMVGGFSIEMLVVDGERTVVWRVRGMRRFFWWYLLKCLWKLSFRGKDLLQWLQQKGWFRIFSSFLVEAFSTFDSMDAFGWYCFRCFLKFGRLENHLSALHKLHLYCFRLPSWKFFLCASKLSCRVNVLSHWLHGIWKYKIKV